MPFRNNGTNWVLNGRFTGRTVEAGTSRKAARPRVMHMRDWIADWNKWSRAERILAVLVTFVLLLLPLSLLISGKAGV